MSEQVPTLARTDASEPLKLVLIDQSADARDEARDLADERLDQELNEGGKVKKFLNGIWKGNIAKEFYRQKYTREAEVSIQETGAVFAGEGDQRTRAINATIDRFQSEYDEVIHTDTGEKREVQADDSDIATGMKQLVREFVSGNLNERTLQEERTRFLNEYREQHGTEALGKGVVSVDNLLAVAKSVAGSVEHGESLDNVLNNMQVITGEARNGARTEANYNRVDGLIDKLSKHKIGSLVGPEVVATAVTTAAFIARLGSHSVINAATKTLLPGVAAGLWAGLRENKRTKDDRAQHAREMAVGGEFTQDDTRRVEIDKTRYEALPAVDLTRHLNELAAPERMAQGSEAVKAALDALAAVQARTQLSDREKIDLISYSDKADVGEERMMLDLARREVKLALEAHLTEDMRTQLMIDHEQPLSEVVQDRADIAIEVLNGELSEKDKLFNKLKRKRVLTAGAIGAATGIAGGLIVQEAVAALDPSRFGLIDAIRGDEAVPLSDGLVHQTILEGIARGDTTVERVDPSSTYQEYDTTPNGSIELSDDHTLEKNSDGTMDLVAPGGEPTVEGLVVDSEGRLDQASLDKLDAAGMVVEDNSYPVETTTTTEQTVTTEQYLANHSTETTNVVRELWYGNDTPNYDRNELGIHRGGNPEAPGIVDGGYQYSIAGMSPEGSWQGGERIDWNQASAEGDLFVAVSASTETQDTVFMVPIGPDGAVNIPADSPAGQFFSNENNEVSFNGRYMEIVQATGVTPEGQTEIRPLATLVGESSVTEIVDTIETKTTEFHAEYTITTDGYEKTVDNFTEMAPVIPVLSRRPLEVLSQRRNGNEVPTSPYYGNEISEYEQQEILRQISPRLRENPDAELSPAEEYNWYRDEVIRNRGQEYVDRMETFARNNPVLASISPDIASITTIPVGAAYESETIYDTLSVLSQQDPDALARSPILLNVNWVEGTVDNPDDYAKMQKTVSEIERAQRDFPQLKVAVMQQEYPVDEVRKTGGPIGYATEDLVNAALLTLNDKVASGVLPPDHDVLIIRSDADVRGQSRNHLANLQKASAENRDLDVVKGVTRFGVEETQQFPGFGIITNFSSMINVASTRENNVHTGGANFGVRASTLAAIGGIGKQFYKNEETGEIIRYTGAGSDDVQIGRRIRVARGIDVGGASGAYYNTAVSTNDPNKKKRIKVVTGAAIDTNPERLLPYYLQGKSFQEAWEDKINGFMGGANSYRDRSADADLIRNAEKDDYSQPSAFDVIEASFSKELSFSSEESVRKALAVAFAGVAGAYTVSGEIGKKSVEFKLTDAGRAFIKHRVERESNGRFGSYGSRMMRRHYGVAPGKRKPVSLRPPMVRPLVSPA